MSICPCLMCPRTICSWTLRFLYDAFLGRCVPWNVLFIHKQFIPSAWVPICCRVDVSPTYVSLTESSWMLRPLNKASLGYCAPWPMFPNPGPRQAWTAQRMGVACHGHLVKPQLRSSHVTTHKPRGLRPQQSKPNITSVTPHKNHLKWYSESY